MKLSDCIKELEDKKKRYGDLDVMRFLIHDRHSMSDHFALHNGKRATQKQWLKMLEEKEGKTVAIIKEDLKDKPKTCDDCGHFFNGICSNMESENSHYGVKGQPPCMDFKATRRKKK